MNTCAIYNHRQWFPVLLKQISGPFFDLMKQITGHGCEIDCGRKRESKDWSIFLMNIMGDFGVRPGVETTNLNTII